MYIRTVFVSVREFLKLSLYHSIVNITEFHLDIQLRLVHYLTSDQE